MHEAWIHLAEDVRTSGANVNIMAVDRQYNVEAVKKLDIQHYPTIRLYQGKSFKDLQYDEDLDGKDLTLNKFNEFLSSNGVRSPT